MGVYVSRDRGTKMIQLKATCLRCGGTGYNPLDTSASEFLPPLLCPDCEGKGILMLDDEKWDIELEHIRGPCRPTYPLHEYVRLEEEGMQVKAICKTCKGMGEIKNASKFMTCSICRGCNGEGAFRLSGKRWDITLKRIGRPHMQRGYE